MRTELLQRALELERRSGLRSVLTSEVMGPDGGCVIWPGWAGEQSPGYSQP